MYEKYEVIDQVIKYLSNTWDKVFYVLIGSTVQIFMVQRARQAKIDKGENVEPLNKTTAVGIFLTAVLIGWMGANIAILKGYKDWAGIVAGMASIFSLGIVSYVQDNLSRLLDKYTKK